MEENYKVETYYLDDNGNMVEPEKATRGVIRELDDNGNLVRETWGTFSDEPRLTGKELDDYIASLIEKEKNK